MTIAVPTEQFRRQYLFVAPTTFDENWVNLVAPSGADIELDGEPVTADSFEPIGSSGYGVARLRLSQSDVHTVEGGASFGATVYGYGQYTSYMYPGGLDLQRLAPAPIY